MEETGLNMSVSSPNNTQNNDAEIASESMTRPDNAHSTGVADSGRWSTKRIAMYALFVALSGFMEKVFHKRKEPSIRRKVPSYSSICGIDMVNEAQRFNRLEIGL